MYERDSESAQDRLTDCESQRLQRHSDLHRQMVHADRARQCTGVTESAREAKMKRYRENMRLESVSEVSDCVNSMVQTF